MIKLNVPFPVTLIRLEMASLKLEMISEKLCVISLIIPLSFSESMPREIP